MPFADQVWGGEGDGADVIAVDQRDQNRPEDQLDLERAEAVLVQKMRNLNFRLARHRFPQRFWLLFNPTPARKLWHPSHKEKRALMAGDEPASPQGTRGAAAAFSQWLETGWAVRRAMAANLEDYALIGDCQTAALVGRDGSIDWLCWPRFDSGACFAALLGTRDNGRWLLSATDPAARVSRRYRDATLILETEIETADGAASVIDFMPLRGKNSDVVRLVCGKRGRVAMCTELIVRFDYGLLVPWVTNPEGGGWRAICGPDLVVLRTPVKLRGKDFTTVGEFTVAAGETVPFVLTYGASYLASPGLIDATEALRETKTFWRGWANLVKSSGRWSDAVQRSLITLKALT